MDNLFQKRLRSHLIQITHYLKYVFNDFFILALMFFIGGLGYEYSQFIKIIPAGLWWEKWALIVTILVGLQVGSLVTLVKKADYVFWMPMEQNFLKYFKKGLHYSMLVSSVIQLIIWTIAIPFIMKALQSNSQLAVFSVLILMIMLKIWWLQIYLMRNYRLWKLSVVITEWIFPLLILLLSFYVSFTLSIIISFIMICLNQMIIRKTINASIDWNWVISCEQSHEEKLNRFFNMFTDVKGMRGKVQRRKYLDWMLNMHGESAYAFLYTRGIIRNKEVSGLTSRLFLVGIVLTLVIHNAFLVILLGIILVYLIIFQIIPFYTNFSDNVFTMIYPISQDKQTKDFGKSVTRLMYPLIILLGGMALISNGWITAVILLAVLMAELLLIQKTYIPAKLKQLL